MEFLLSSYVDNNIYVKILIIGDPKVGKTLFNNRIKEEGDLNYQIFYQKEKENSYIPTIVEFSVKLIKYKNKYFKFQIWDISGNKRYQNKGEYYSRGAEAILIFYDALNRQSFERAQDLYQRFIYLNGKKETYFLVRNKYELALNSEIDDINFVPDEEAMEFATQNNIIFCHSSQFEKYETGTNFIFEYICNKICKRIDEEQK